MGQSTGIKEGHHELVVGRGPAVVCISGTINFNAVGSMVAPFGTIYPKTSSIECETCFSIRHIVCGEGSQIISGTRASALVLWYAIVAYWSSKGSSPLLPGSQEES